MYARVAPPGIREIHQALIRIEALIRLDRNETVMPANGDSGDWSDVVPLGGADGKVSSGSCETLGGVMNVDAITEAQPIAKLHRVHALLDGNARRGSLFHAERESVSGSQRGVLSAPPAEFRPGPIRKAARFWHAEGVQFEDGQADPDQRMSAEELAAVIEEPEDQLTEDTGLDFGS